VKTWRKNGKKKAAKRKDGKKKSGKKKSGNTPKIQFTSHLYFTNALRFSHILEKHKK